MQDLETLYQLYSQDIYRYLYSLTHDPHWSEDLLSETFLKAVRGFSSFEKRSSIKTWLFMIARNVWIDSLRRKRPCISYDDLLANYIEDESPSSERLEEECANRELVERITELLSQCKPVSAKIIQMRVQGYSFAEISSVCNISESSARTLNFRTRNWIRDTLKKEELI